MEPAAPPLLNGLQLGPHPYRLVRQLGVSALCEAWLAEDLRQSRKVVVKLVQSRLLLPGSLFAARFHEEVATLRRLEHPSLLRILDQNDFQGRPFLVLPHCGAGNLKIRMYTGPGGKLEPKPPENLGLWLPAVAQALDFLHSQGLAHRDVKPSSILFDESGQAYLADLALTRASFQTLQASVSRLDSMIFATPRYCAPEILESRAVHRASDQFSLAMIVWEWLSGRSFFRGETAPEVLAVHKVALSFLPPWVPAPWRDVLKKALARKPEERFASCEEFSRVMLEKLQGAAGVVLPDVLPDDGGDFNLFLPEDAPTPPRTTLLEAGGPAQTRVDLPRQGGPPPMPGSAPAPSPPVLDGKATLAGAQQAHDEFVVRFLVTNDLDFRIFFETSTRDWTGAWNAWEQRYVLPGETIQIGCRGAIRVQLRYNCRRLGPPVAYEVAEICPQLWPSDEPARMDEIDSRYRFCFRDGRIDLEFRHRALR